VKLSQQWTNRILTFAAPSILCIVAARQVMLVQTERLTPWKGGGFGMFSTVESGSTRIFRVRLEKREGDQVMSLPVKLPPELAPLVRDLTQRPTEKSAENLAIVLSNLTWFEAPELDDVYRLSAAEFAAIVVSAQVSGQRTPVLERVLCNGPRRHATPQEECRGQAPPDDPEPRQGSRSKTHTEPS